MASAILKPLAIFYSQSQSHRNVGDAWRTLAEKPSTDADQSTVIETTFDFVLGINYASGQRPELNTTPSNIRSVEIKPTNPYHPRRQHLFDTIAFLPTMGRISSGDRERCEDTQDYSATVFPTVSEEMVWQVAGYLLAWRVVMGSKIGSVEYSTGRSKYMLERRKKTSATFDFLTDQA